MNLVLMTETPACKINGSSSISESLKDIKSEKGTLKTITFHFTSTITITLFFVSTN